MALFNSAIASATSSFRRPSNDDLLSSFLDKLPLRRLNNQTSSTPDIISIHRIFNLLPQAVIYLLNNLKRGVQIISLGFCPFCTLSGAGHLYCVISYNLHFSRSTGLSIVLVRGGDLLSLSGFWGLTRSFVVTWEERWVEWIFLIQGPEVFLSGSIGAEWEVNC